MRRRANIGHGARRAGRALARAVRHAGTYVRENPVEAAGYGVGGMIGIPLAAYFAYHGARIGYHAPEVIENTYNLLFHNYLSYMPEVSPGTFWKVMGGIAGGLGGTGLGLRIGLGIRERTTDFLYDGLGIRRT
jgi:hypothetical protein